MATKNFDLDELIKQCKEVITKYRNDDVELWEEVEKQIDSLKKGLLQKKWKMGEGGVEALNFGPVLARAYDGKAEKEEMQPLYTLYYFVQMG